MSEALGLINGLLMSVVGLICMACAWSSLGSARLLLQAQDIQAAQRERIVAALWFLAGLVAFK